MKFSRRSWVRCCLSTVFAACCLGALVSTSYADDEAGAARWYKGATHCHSLWSDGDDFPEMVADWYKSHGYDFLSLTDHDTLMEGDRWRNVGQGKDHVPAAVLEKCQKHFGPDWPTLRGESGRREVKLKTFDEIHRKLDEPGKFLMIQGEEISAKYLDRHVHVCAVNLAEAIPPKKGLSPIDTIANNLRAVEEQSRRLNRPILAHLNHPNWADYDIAPEMLAAVPAVRFFEVCNAGGSGIRHYGDATHASVEKLWDVANTIRIAKMKAPPLYGVGSDDTHGYQQFAPKEANPGRAWIMVRAKSLDTHALLDAMDRGDFYASTGVVLDDVAFDAKRRVVSVKVKSEPGVKYTIEFIGTLEGVDPTGKTADAGKHSKRPGQTYSPEVGKVLARSRGTAADYRMTGRELYVRAVVRSDKPIANAPEGEVQRQEAWCQTMGWRK